VASIAVVGYGRFGEALAHLARAAGVRVRAFDLKWSAPPAGLSAPSLREACEGADLVAVAVPIDRMGPVFRELSGMLGPGQIAMDVASVKLEPSRAMEEAFGARIPFVATHPLFGPASLARGERPFRVVVCPNPLHPGAVARVEGFWRALGCEVSSVGAEAHDREMALTHALAFFVAKGMLDVGVPPEAPRAPASFQGIARTIEAVQVDAGHLFAALHRHNPFAPAARRRLLEALAAADRLLLRPDEGGPEPALAIPEPPAHSPELLEARELIDEVDEELLRLLARRAELSRRAGIAKAGRGLGVADPGRETKLLESRRRRAAELGLDADFADELFQAILRFSRSVQR